MRVFRFAPLEKLWDDAAFHGWFWPAVAFSVLTWVVSVVGLFPIRARESIVLHYTAVFGIDRFGPWSAGFIPALVALAVLTANTLVAAALVPRSRVIAHLVGVFTAVLLFGYAAAALLIVLLNR